MEYILRAAAENGITQGADEIIMSMNIFDDFSKDDFISSIKTQLKDSITESELMTQYQFLLRQELYDIESSFEQAFASVLNNVSSVMKDLISEVSGVIDEEINGMTGNLNDYMGTAEVSGYAHFNGDSIRKIRLDNKMQIKVPDEMILNTYLEILAYNSMDLGNVDQGGCLEDGEELVEITVGADDVPFDWISDDIRASLNFKMSVKNQGSGYGANGVGGGFELTGGTVQFQTFEIHEFAATFAASADECYLGGRASARFDSYEVSAGIFFGKTCGVTPLQLVDDQVGDLFAISEPFPPSKNILVFDFSFSSKSIYYDSFGANTTASTPPNTIMELPTISRHPNGSSVKIPAEMTPTTISLKYNIAHSPAPRTDGDHIIITPVGIK